MGDGALAREIETAGIPCVGSDIVDRGWPEVELRSFYDFPDSLAPAIITNPPFCEINARDGHGRWLRHTLGMPTWRYCALLLSWAWPAARANGLGALLDTHPFSYCYLICVGSWTSPVQARHRSGTHGSFGTAMTFARSRASAG